MNKNTRKFQFEGQMALAKLKSKYQLPTKKTKTKKK